jgi:purine-binding chemotaxis protein CheW
MKHLSGKYLSFRLAREEYAIPILAVREIIGLMNITPVPHAPRDVRGVINLRGKIVPVVDLRRRFAMSDTESTPESCIIVVNLNEGNGSFDTGILVDSVREVLEIRGEDISPPPPLGKAISNDFILGMAKTKDSVTILLEIDDVLKATDVSSAVNKQHDAALA